MFKGLLPNELDIESCSSDSDIEDTVKKSESVDILPTTSSDHIVCCNNLVEASGDLSATPNKQKYSHHLQPNIKAELSSTKLPVAVKSSLETLVQKKSEFETKITEAINCGNIDEADGLNNGLIEIEENIKLTEENVAKAYLEKKKKTKRINKKKKLHWG